MTLSLELATRLTGAIAQQDSVAQLARRRISVHAVALSGKTCQLDRRGPHLAQARLASLPARGGRTHHSTAQVWRRAGQRPRISHRTPGQ